jgi:hypothetical protein
MLAGGVARARHPLLAFCIQRASLTVSRLMLDKALLSIYNFKTPWIAVLKPLARQLHLFF